MNSKYQSTNLILRSILFYGLGLLVVNILSLCNPDNGVYFAFIIGIVSSFPILTHVISNSFSKVINILIISYWPLMILIYLLVDDLSTGSGDGQVFYEQTVLFSERVFQIGKFWPGFEYFIQHSVIYWFTTYFYAVPYFLFGGAYDSIFPFNCYAMVLMSLFFF